MAEDGAPWFVVRPGAERRGELIHLPLMYTGRAPLAAPRVFVFGEHIRGVSSAASDGFGPSADVGDLVAGDEFRLTMLTDGEHGPLAFTLDVVADERHVHKLAVEAPEPTSVPVVTGRPAP